VKLSGNYVLDSFALLVFLVDEPGADLVRDIIAHGQRRAGSIWIPVINLGECLAIVEREQGLPAPHRAIAAVRQLPIQEAIADHERTFAAVHIRASRCPRQSGCRY
jgi:PIN domain nuclease of toxin-antitoxin system